MLKKLSLVIIVLVVLFPIISCSTTSLEIKENTQRFNGRKVFLSGEITTLINIPLSEVSIYVFKDKAGSVIVLSAAVHHKNDDFLLKGTVVAFPESSSKENSQKYIDISKNFFIENNILTKEKAEKVAIATGKVINKILSSLGNVFIITEEM